ncbi:hypothetical protein [Undibacterium luofuense]|uniref:hypothetical protein n=1 Tax=Undibacterium luofuense TaxID=2828733 RepID=UPI0030ECC97C
MTSVTDANIPVLTEIIEPVSEPVTPASIAIPDDIPVLNIPLKTESETVPVESPAGLSVVPELDWDAMELTVREAVLKQVLTRVDFVLEHRVRDGLADVLQTAVDKLADEIRTGLANSLNELVTRSVQQELLKIRSGKNGN